MRFRENSSLNLQVLVDTEEMESLVVGKILCQQKQNTVWHDSMDYPDVVQHVQPKPVDRDASLHEVEHSLVNFD